jgi:hypothetical protein
MQDTRLLYAKIKQHRVKVKKGLAHVTWNKKNGLQHPRASNRVIAGTLLICGTTVEKHDKRRRRFEAYFMEY